MCLLLPRRRLAKRALRAAKEQMERFPVRR
jgi:hypothetical protein